MANQVVLKQFQKGLAQWPKDLLRPHIDFAASMQKRIETKPPTEAEANALSTLLENRYSRRYPLSEKTMNPASDPGYYAKLQTELQEAPGRSWFERLSNKIMGVVRMS